MPEISPSTRDEALALAPTSPRRKQRFLGVVFARGLGLAGGLNLHRFVDLEIVPQGVV